MTILLSFRCCSRIAQTAVFYDTKKKPVLRLVFQHDTTYDDRKGLNRYDVFYDPVPQSSSVRIFSTEVNDLQELLHHLT